MTSIHPPLWWKGPLGPLTAGRDLYVVGLLYPADPVHLAVGPGDRAEGRHELQTSRDRGDLLSDVRLSDVPPSDGRRARHGVQAVPAGPQVPAAWQQSEDSLRRRVASPSRARGG